LEALGVRPLSCCVSYRVAVEGAAAHGSVVEAAVRQAVLAAESYLSSIMRSDEEFAAVQGAVERALPGFRVLVVPSFTATLSLGSSSSGPAGGHPPSSHPAAAATHQPSPRAPYYGGALSGAVQPPPQPSQLSQPHRPPHPYAPHPQHLYHYHPYFQQQHNTHHTWATQQPPQQPPWYGWHITSTGPLQTGHTPAEPTTEPTPT
ncbi:hypothetical protein Agub_g5709, partial [Astrephomene gubernaculifera]